MKRVISIVMILSWMMIPCSSLAQQKESSTNQSDKFFSQVAKRNPNPWTIQLWQDPWGNSAQLLPLIKQQRDILAKLDKLLIQEASMKRKFGSNHPSYVLVKQEIAVLKQQLADSSKAIESFYSAKGNKSDVFLTIDRLESISKSFKPSSMTEKSLKNALDQVFALRKKQKAEASSKVMDAVKKATAAQLRKRLDLTKQKNAQLENLMEENRKILHTRKMIEEYYKTLQTKEKELEDQRALVLLFEGDKSKEAKKKLADLQKQRTEIQRGLSRIAIQRAELVKKLSDFNRMHTVLTDQVRQVQRFTKDKESRTINRFWNHNAKPVKTKTVTKKAPKTSKTKSVEQRLSRVEKQLDEVSALLKQLVKQNRRK